MTLLQHEICFVKDEAKSILLPAAQGNSPSGLVRWFRASTESARWAERLERSCDTAAFS